VLPRPALGIGELAQLVAQDVALCTDLIGFLQLALESLPLALGRSGRALELRLLAGQQLARLAIGIDERLDLALEVHPPTAFILRFVLRLGGDGLELCDPARRSRLDLAARLLGLALGLDSALLGRFEPSAGALQLVAETLALLTGLDQGGRLLVELAA